MHLEHRHQEQRERPERIAVKKIGGNSPDADLRRDEVEPPDRFMKTSSARSRGASDVGSPACVEVTDMRGGQRA
jgi:hypothetical protein